MLSDILIEPPRVSINAAEADMTAEQWEHFYGDMFTGFDTDRTMLRLSAMNLMLRSITQPRIDYVDSVLSAYAALAIAESNMGGQGGLPSAWGYLLT